MCGKFTAMMSWKEYCFLAGVGTSGTGELGPDMMDPQKQLGTFTPMSNLPVLHLNPVGHRRITAMRWGWYDHKIADPRRSFKHLHARSEDIDRTPTWTDPFHTSRGVVFTKSFNIGEEMPDGKIKQWICSRADGQPVAIAVIYSAWETMFGLLRTCVMVTTQSCSPLDLRDDRMPAILRDDSEIKMWIGETPATAAELKALLRPFDSSLVMREQEAGGPPPKPKKGKTHKPTAQPSFDL